MAANADEIGAPDAMVFPGQGGMKNLMAELRQRGLDDAIRAWIEADKPYFGICLGLQALFDHAEEGDGPGLGIFRGSVPRFRLDPAFKIPHMGWNAVSLIQPQTLPGGPADGDQFYFVHSYHAKPTDPSLIWTETEYGGKTFCSGICRGKCFATQFHPEKSQRKGLRIQQAFLRLLAEV